jgi:hypothetical protein
MVYPVDILWIVSLVAKYENRTNDEIEAKNGGTPPIRVLFALIRGQSTGLFRFREPSRLACREATIVISIPRSGRGSCSSL